MRGRPDKVLKDLVEAKYKLTLSLEREGSEMDSFPSSSDDESEKAADHEQMMIASLTEEIRELKQQLEESEKKRFSLEKLFELKRNGDGESKLDEENRRVKEQLKCKMERFQRLEEAHEKLKDEYRSSRKELQEAQSERSSSSSSSSSSSALAKVKSKLKNVEQGYKAKEAEWSSKLEKLTDELDDCRSELEIKDAVIKELSAKSAAVEKAHMNCSLISRIEKMTEESRNSMTELEMQEVCDALERADCKVSGIEFELRSWKAAAEQMLSRLEECQQIRRQVERSLLAEVEVGERLKLENDSAYRTLEEQERIIDDLRKLIALSGVQIKPREADAPLGLCERISEFSCEDTPMIGMLGNVMHNFDEEMMVRKENLNCTISPTTKKIEVFSNDRSPFREINAQLHLGASS